MKGHAGKILKVDLSNKEISTLDTERYEQWTGGHGIAAAIFFDHVKDKTIGCFDPRNTLVIMAGLFAGTLVPAACRAELVGIQAQSYPTEWFGRSNCGGRFPALLKLAGYDGMILSGAADTPTWYSMSLTAESASTMRVAYGVWVPAKHRKPSLGVWVVIGMAKNPPCLAIRTRG